MTVVGHQRTGIASVGREASNCERARLGGRLGERGEGGKTGESVVCDDSILHGDRRRRPGEIHFSLSSNCKKFVRSTTGNYCGKQIIFFPRDIFILLASGMIITSYFGSDVPSKPRNIMLQL